MSENDRFRVVIVGGGVAGLSLANALEVCSTSFFISCNVTPLLTTRNVCHFSKRMSTMFCWSAAARWLPKSAHPLACSPAQPA